jgi:TolA-binding protein
VFRPATFLAFCALAGCAGAPRAHADLEARLRQLQQEQERQARQIELLEQRVVIAEDTARLARQAVVGVRGTVRIAPEGELAVDAIPSSEAPGSDATEQPVAEPEANVPRPVVRAAGRDTTPPSANPIVVREDDRLPIAPVPPQLAPPARGPRPAAPAPTRPAPREIGPESELPAATPPAPMPETLVPGVSSVRDPRAAPAYDRALALARGGRCPEAIDALSAFLIRWPDHPFADNAMYWRAECILAGGDVRRAVSEFEGLLARFPVGNKVPDALYKLVVCYRRLGDETRAREYAARLLRDFPRSDLAARVRGERNAT